MITIKSTNSPNSIDGSPFDDFGFNYLWRLRGLGKHMPAFRGMCIVKNGFAKYCRAGGFNGVESRIIETLRGIEESLDVPRGTLRGGGAPQAGGRVRQAIEIVGIVARPRRTGARLDVVM